MINNLKYKITLVLIITVFFQNILIGTSLAKENNEKISYKIEEQNLFNTNQTLNFQNLSIGNQTIQKEIFPSISFFPSIFHNIQEPNKNTGGFSIKSIKSGSFQFFPENIWALNFIAPGAAQTTMGDIWRGYFWGSLFFLTSSRLLMFLLMGTVQAISNLTINRKAYSSAFYKEQEKRSENIEKFWNAWGTIIYLSSTILVYVFSIVDASNMYSTILSNSTKVPSNAFTVKALEVKLLKF